MLGEVVANQPVGYAPQQVVVEAREWASIGCADGVDVRLHAGADGLSVADEEKPYPRPVEGARHAEEHGIGKVLTHEHEIGRERDRREGIVLRREAESTSVRHQSGIRAAAGRQQGGSRVPTRCDGGEARYLR